eukprot:gb/GECG01015698.1/.p1 GENE.gb/GECG01015698.1/~~gb/GECG01015698.1/.p1  ORF type:complete len:526 (+),score=77.20 gb/GECG01015698.1/:1-1578(+)
MAAEDGLNASGKAMEHEKLKAEEEAISSPVVDSGANSSEGDEKQKRAEELRLEGNKHFKAKRFQSALYAYTEALELYPTAALYGNRAFAQLQVENFGSAISDTTEAINLDPTYTKAYYRRGSAYLALGKYKSAKKDLYYVCQQCPQDRDARVKLQECQKQIKRQQFAEAIASEATVPASERFAKTVGDMAVPSTYQGPQLPEDGTVTREFVGEMMQYFKKQKMVPKKFVVQMLISLKRLLAKLPSMVDVTIPEKNTDGSEGVITVCGDTHGQYYDLLNIFEMNGLPSENNVYLFNGDFVDRGSFSVENVMTLFAWKLVYPEHVILTRGNHETVSMNKVYGFEGEVKHKLDSSLMELFTEVFQALPLAACINNKAFVVHGGLMSKDGTTLDEIRNIRRFMEPPETGLMSDLMWSDPQPFAGRGPSKRGVGLSFGPDITKKFLEDNNLELLIRSHEVKDEGYLVEHDGKCITIFSAPNYCDQMGNKGAFITMKADCKPEFTTFEAVSHPPVKPMQYAGGGWMNMLGM